MPALSIRSLRKSFLLGSVDSPQRRNVLADVDLELAEAEVLGIVGNENAGKTTLLLCAAGLLRRDSGSIYWYGERFGGGGCLPGLAYVPPVPTYYPFLTVREVLDYYSSQEDSSPRDRRNLIEASAARLDLTDQLSTPVCKLAIDGLKRVGIAHALVKEPRVILLDATLDGLSSGAAAAHRAIDDAALSGIAIIVTSRNAGILAPVATRMVVMDYGRVTRSFSAEPAIPGLSSSESVFRVLPTPMRHIAEQIH